MSLQYTIVLGCPRSGTTFLMRCLDALPYTECLSGICFPVPIAHLAAQNLPEEIKDCLDYALESTFQVYLDGYTGSRFGAVHHFLDGSMSLRELKEFFYREYKLQRFIYKEPFFSFAPEYIYRSLPNCRIIYIYRDGRDCANSLVQSYGALTDKRLGSLKSSAASMGYRHNELYVPWWVEPDQADAFIASKPFVRAIWMWKEMVRRCDSFFSKSDVLLSGRVLQIKYEDLAYDPITIGGKIASHLGLDLNPRFSKRLQQVSTRSIGKYKRRDTDELKAAENIAYAELKHYGMSIE
jgi:hypothetical protein